MYCHICGKELSDQAKICLECGMPVPETRENGARKTTQQSINVAANPITAKAEPPQPSPDDYPMKWYYYLRYAHLFMVAAGLFISGIFSMAADKEILWGIFQIATGIYALVVRKALANFMESAPPLLAVLYALQYVGSATYSFYQYLTGYSYEESMWITMFVIDIIIFGILFGTNIAYFAKRKEQFTN